MVGRYPYFYAHKNLKMDEVFFLVEEALEGGYNAKTIGESIYTQGDSLDELKDNIRNAVQCHFDDEFLPKISIT